MASRLLILDIVRGFALVGVLIPNMVSFNSQQIPDDVLTAVSTPADRLLLDINAVFIEWKFMTLFSILFGYSFGLIISSVERRQDDPVAFFIRRMGWLFLIGLIHTSFWVYDVLHLYAVSGLLLLPFRRASRRTILLTSVALMFLVPLADVLETLGRFLFGYYLLRSGVLEQVEHKRKLFLKVLAFSAPIMLIYFVLQWLELGGMIDLGSPFLKPFVKAGILGTSLTYASTVVLFFIARPHAQSASNGCSASAG